MEPFEIDGMLQPGLHHYTYQEYIQQFVADFPVSHTRKEIHTLSFLWLAELKRQIKPIEVWFNGDFISAKENPKTLELCVFLDIDSLDNDLAESCLELQKCASNYKCTAYFGFTYHQQNSFLGVNGPYYWTEQFGFNPQNIPKGIIVLSWDEILIALT